MKTPEIKNLSSAVEEVARGNLLKLFADSPIPAEERITQLFLYMRKQDIARLLMLNELFEKILPVQGNILDFGTRWGRNMVIFQALSAIYEPYNHGRKIIGFDSFEGFPAVHELDGKDSIVKEGAYATTPNYDDHLQQVLSAQGVQNPLSHIARTELRKGDASVTVTEYFKANPESSVALAYFDFDIYLPTKACLEAIKDRVTKGSIIAFDELNSHSFPGETQALKEVFGFDAYPIRRSKFSSIQAYIEIQ